MLLDINFKMNPNKCDLTGFVYFSNWGIFMVIQKGLQQYVTCVLNNSGESVVAGVKLDSASKLESLLLGSRKQEQQEALFMHIPMEWLVLHVFLSLMDYLARECTVRAVRAQKRKPILLFLQHG